MLVSGSKFSRRRGTVCVLVAVSSILILSMVAITLDGGLLQDDKRHAQATADAAAMAAAAVLYENYPKNSGADSDGKASDAAFSFAAGNGFTNDGTNSVVTVHIPPTSGIYTGKAGYAEVLVTQYQNRAFSRIFGSDPIPVRARAVARGAWVVPNVGVLVLKYTGRATLSDQGNGFFTEVGAPVIVNSNDSSAAVDGGNGTMKAPEFDITGNYTTSGNGQFLTTPTANNILTGVHPTPDPLAWLPVPSQPSAGTMTTVNNPGAGKTYTLTPGTYYNLPNFGNGDTVIFQQASAGNNGIYYFASGGFNSQGANIQMDSNTSGGIMMYNAGTGSGDRIVITGNSSGSVNITPISTGIYKGMALFQNRSGTQNLDIEGNGTFNITGTLYASSALLQVKGNGGVTNIGSQYVTQELNIAGNGNVSITYAGDNVARTRIILLVE